MYIKSLLKKTSFLVLGNLSQDFSVPEKNNFIVVTQFNGRTTKLWNQNLVTNFNLRNNLITISISKARPTATTSAWFNFSTFFSGKYNPDAVFACALILWTRTRSINGTIDLADFKRVDILFFLLIQYIFDQWLRIRNYFKPST